MNAHVWTVGGEHVVISGADRLMLSGDIVTILSKAEAGRPNGQLIAVVKVSDRTFVSLGPPPQSRTAAPARRESSRKRASVKRRADAV